MNGFPLLSLIVFMPVIGALVLLFVPGTNHRAIRWIALATVLVTFALSLGLLGYDPSGSEFVREALFIDRFEEAGTERPVNLNRCSNDSLRDLRLLQHEAASYKQTSASSATPR